jgi:stringent starvation protein B
MQTVIAPRGCYLVALAREVDEGEHVEVDDETAESLIEQGWTSLRSASAKKAAARRARADEHDDDTPETTDEPAETVEES